MHKSYLNSYYSNFVKESGKRRKKMHSLLCIRSKVVCEVLLIIDAVCCSTFFLLYIKGMPNSYKQTFLAKKIYLQQNREGVWCM